jgi:hypothetical protein
LLLGPVQADDDVKNTPPPNPQPENQEKGHLAHALSSVYGRPAYSGLPTRIDLRHAEDFEKPLTRLRFFLF